METHLFWFLTASSKRGQSHKSAAPAAAAPVRSMQPHSSWSVSRVSITNAMFGELFMSNPDRTGRDVTT